MHDCYEDDDDWDDEELEDDAQVTLNDLRIALKRLQGMEKAKLAWWNVESDWAPARVRLTNAWQEVDDFVAMLDAMGEAGQVYFVCDEVNPANGGVHTSETTLGQACLRLVQLEMAHPDNKYEVRYSEVGHSGFYNHAWRP